MRIAIVKTQAAGGGVDHFTTDDQMQGTYMTGYDLLDHGIRINFGNTEHRTYAWIAVLFIDQFMTPAR